MANKPNKIDCEDQFFDSLRGKNVEIELLKGKHLCGVIKNYNDHVLILYIPNVLSSNRILIYKSAIATVRETFNCPN